MRRADVHRQLVRQTERAHYVMQLSVYFSELADLPGVRFACTHRFADTWYNQAYDVVCTEGDAAGLIGTIHDYLRSRDRLPCVYLSPAVEPASFAGLLEGAGFGEFETEAWMFYDFTETDAPGLIPDAIDVRQVSTDADLEAFAHVYRDGFPGPEVEMYIGAAVDGFRHQSPLVDTFLYLASWEGEPAGIVSLYRLGAFAGVYDVATVGSWRRRGIARALLRRAGMQARDMGCDYLFLQTVAGEVGEKAFARLGYSTRYVRRGYTTKDAIAGLRHG